MKNFFFHDSGRDTFWELLFEFFFKLTVIYLLAYFMSLFAKYLMFFIMTVFLNYFLALIWGIICMLHANACKPVSPHVSRRDSWIIWRNKSTSHQHFVHEAAHVQNICFFMFKTCPISRSHSWSIRWVWSRDFC